jgi:hypothetical protein
MGEPEDSKRETIVFAYDTEDQRRELLDMFPGWFSRDAGLRIVSLSHDNEMKRVTLLEEAVERYSYRDELRNAVTDVMEHPNLSRFNWDDLEAA